MFGAINYAVDTGISAETDYVYTARDGNCHNSDYDV